MADLAGLLREAPDLVKRKTARVVIMGGVGPQLDPRGFVVADKRAYNNTTHQSSADYTYARVQELGLPLVVVNKEATYTAAAPRSFYDGIAATGHPVGVYLKDQQKQSLQHLWEGILQGHLPPALTPEWFFRTFTDVDLDRPGGKGRARPCQCPRGRLRGNLEASQQIQSVRSVGAAGGDPRCRGVVVPERSSRRGQMHVQIIGKNSIKDATLMKDLLAGLGIESLNPPMPRKSRTGTAPGYPPRQHVAEEDAPWTRPLADYEPPEYTADAVFQNEGKWADPKDVKDVKRTFLTRTGSGEVAVPLDAAGPAAQPTRQDRSPGSRPPGQMGQEPGWRSASHTRAS